MIKTSEVTKRIEFLFNTAKKTIEKGGTVGAGLLVDTVGGVHMYNELDAQETTEKRQMCCYMAGFMESENKIKRMYLVMEVWTATKEGVPPVEQEDRGEAIVVSVSTANESVTYIARIARDETTIELGDYSELMDASIHDHLSKSFWRGVQEGIQAATAMNN